MNREETLARRGIGVQVFEPDIIEVPPGYYRFVRYEPCPLGRRRKHCTNEHHHWGRGDHVVPLHPEWNVGDGLAQREGQK